MSYSADDRARLGLRESATFDRSTIAAIHRAAETGIYDIRGWGAKRPLPHFDDLLFLGASMSRYPGRFFPLSYRYDLIRAQSLGVSRPRRLANPPREILDPRAHAREGVPSWNNLHRRAACPVARASP